MAGVALVFPGQGAQRPGMGLSLYEGSEPAREVFDRYERLRPGTLRQCFEAGQEELSRTLNAQPCLYALSMAVAAELRSRGLVPAAAAGFSLGEVAALSVAGVFGEEDGFRFVCERALRMEEAAERHPGTMAAVMGLPDARVEALCEGIPGVWAVNYNCPGQVVVAGEPGAVEALCRLARAAGARTVALSVSGAFHSPAMDEAADALYEALAGYRLHAPRIPVYSGMDGALWGADIRRQLSRQVRSPVRWEKAVRSMAADGVRTFVEAGAGTTLCGFIRRIDPQLEALGAADPAGCAAALKRLGLEEKHA